MTAAARAKSSVEMDWTCRCVSQTASPKATVPASRWLRPRWMAVPRCELAGCNDLGACRRSGFSLGSGIAFSCLAQGTDRHHFVLQERRYGDHIPFLVALPGDRSMWGNTL